ncbi:MAG TPA: hypothetical protein VJ574_06305 [Candidatus Bathyarchaeia archaeon]|nr:hypothetical protein [Candidatus Bathyarchaeia archaeon]
MRGRLAVLLFLMIFSLLFTSTAVLAQDTVKIKYYFVDSGSCLVMRGDVSSPLWSGVGSGALVLSGKADGEYYEQPAGEITLKGYAMENLVARGCLLLRWTEGDNSKHWVSVTFYSTATSKGFYFNDPFVLGSISQASGNPDDYIRFKGVYCDGQRIQKISGIALLMIGSFPQMGGLGVGIQLLNGPQPIEEHSMFLGGWSETGTQDTPAAQVFRWNVETGSP